MCHSATRLQIAGGFTPAATLESSTQKQKRKFGDRDRLVLVGHRRKSLYRHELRASRHELGTSRLSARVKMWREANSDAASDGHSTIPCRQDPVFFARPHTGPCTRCKLPIAPRPSWAHSRPRLSAPRLLSHGLGILWAASGRRMLRDFGVPTAKVPSNLCSERRFLPSIVPASGDRPTSRRCRCTCGANRPCLPVPPGTSRVPLYLTAAEQTRLVERRQFGTGLSSRRSCNPRRRLGCPPTFCPGADMRLPLPHDALPGPRNSRGMPAG